MTTRTERWRAGATIGGLYGVVFLGFGVYLPFFPLYLAARGLTDPEIAAVIAAPLFGRAVVIPPLARAADRWLDRRLAIGLGAACAAAVLATIILVDGFWPILLVSLVASLAWSIVLPLTDAAAGSLVRRGLVDYGRVRLWGSLAFMAASLGGGLVFLGSPPASIVGAIVATLLLCALVAALTPPAAAGDRSAGASTPMRRLLWRADLAPLVAAAVLIQASHAMLNGFASLHWRGLGHGEGMIGAFWAVGILAEVVLFALAGSLAARLSPAGLIVIGGVAAVLRWLLFPFAASDLAIAAVQTLHGISFGATHLGTIRALIASVGERDAGAAQALTASLTGLGVAAVALASGPIFQAWGGAGFAVMAAVAGLGLVCLALRPLRRPVAPQPQRAGSGGKTVEPS